MLLVRILPPQWRLPQQWYTVGVVQNATAAALSSATLALVIRRCNNIGVVIGIRKITVGNVERTALLAKWDDYDAPRQFKTLLLRAQQHTHGGRYTTDATWIAGRVSWPGPGPQ
jgi:hypothetical protein